MASSKLFITDENIKNISAVFGIHDTNITILEESFTVKITYRDDNIIIIGEEENCEKSKKVLEKIINRINNAEEVTEHAINYLIDEVQEGSIDEVDELIKGFICNTIGGRAIRPKTVGQKNYIDNIRKNTIVFGVGPAGTGKTYLAMAMAITSFKNNEVNRIVLTRPAIEAGEKLGFLPGDLQQKVDPYLRPLYDALYEIMGSEVFLKNLEKGSIEVAPLAYMRGRTLDNAYIILDEAQNTTPEQMKMFLTRIGFGSKVIVTGDTSQIDLPQGRTSGLSHCLKILENISGIGISNLTNRDVVRNPLVQKIVKAYEKYETNINNTNSN